MTQLRPVRSAEELDLLRARALEDNHAVVGATHLVQRGGEVVGYLGLGQIPMVTTWFDSRRMKVRDSLGVVAQGEAILATQGARAVLVPVDPKSPLKAVMPGLGFEELGTCVMYIKQL